MTSGVEKSRAAKRIQIVTTSREDLFAIARLMMQALDPLQLQDPARPLLFALRGSYGAGKSIFIDTFRSEMFDDATTVTFRGRADYDERWRGTIGGQPAEIGFINPCQPGGFSRKKLNDAPQAERAGIFSTLRQDGGLTVIQNKADGQGVDVDIWVEDNWGTLLGYDDSHLATARKSLVKKFDQATKTSNRLCHHDTRAENWVRYLDIRISDPTLLKNREFIQSLQRAAQKFNKSALKFAHTGKQVKPRKTALQPQAA